MKPERWLTLAAALFLAGRWIRCKWRSVHRPVRQPLGGFRCSECGKPGADLCDMGFDHGYVRQTRHYGRERSEGLTRTSEWEE